MPASERNPNPSGWPDLSRLDLAPTMGALHLWSQVVGKVRLAMTPWENHGWHVPLYITSKGLGTGIIPARERAFQIEFDLLWEALEIRSTDGPYVRIPLAPRSVASFHAATTEALVSLGFHVRIDPTPNEIQGAVRFDQDEALRAYDGEVARSYWRALLQVHRVFQAFRTRFVGKCSPIHLFWGSFDLAVTRFSGRPAPRHPGAGALMPLSVAREAYSHEVSSAGFWPATGLEGGPSFYSYSYPPPKEFGRSRILPSEAYFDAALGEFLLPYSAVFGDSDPDETLLAFLQSSYEAAADLGNWDRSSLERADGAIGRPPDGF